MGTGKRVRNNRSTQHAARAAVGVATTADRSQSDCRLPIAIVCAQALFNLSADPDERNNLALNPAHAAVVAKLGAMLKTKIDYPEVAKDVARYNIQMASRWWTQTGGPRWKEILGGTGVGPKSQPPGRNCSDPRHTTSCELSAGQEAYWGKLWRAWPEGYWWAAA